MEEKQSDQDENIVSVATYSDYEHEAGLMFNPLKKKMKNKYHNKQNHLETKKY